MAVWNCGTAGRVLVFSCLHMILIVFHGVRMRAKKSVPLRHGCCFQVKYIYVDFITNLNHEMLIIFWIS